MHGIVSVLFCMFIFHYTLNCSLLFLYLSGGSLLDKLCFLRASFHSHFHLISLYLIILFIILSIYYYCYDPNKIIVCLLIFIMYILISVEKILKNWTELNWNYTAVLLSWYSVCLVSREVLRSNPASVVSSMLTQNGLLYLSVCLGLGLVHSIIFPPCSLCHGHQQSLEVTGSLRDYILFKVSREF